MGRVLDPRPDAASRTCRFEGAILHGNSNLVNWKFHVVRGGRGSLVVDWNNKVNCTRLVWKHTAPYDCVSRVLTIGLSGLSGECGGWGGYDSPLLKGLYYYAK